MHTEQLTATVTSQMYHDTLVAFDLHNQDEMDSFIANIIETKLAENAEQVAIDEYYQEYKHG